MHNDNFFDDAPAQAFSDRIDLLRVDYAANATPESYAYLAEGRVLEDAKASGKLGFSYWQRSEHEGESGQKITLPNFTFYLLEVYSALSGMSGEGANRIRYYSNRVKDSRTDEFVLFGPGKDPIRRGIYSLIKDNLPQGVKYNLHFVAYCPEIDRVVEIKVTKAVESGIVNALVEAARRSGKNKTAKQISLFGLADNDLIWGFRQTGFVKQTKDGDAYTGRGELFFAPSFVCGIVDPSKPERFEIHRKCCELQSQVRASYEERKSKYASAKVVAEYTPSMPNDVAYQQQGATRKQSAPTTMPPANDDYFPPLNDMSGLQEQGDDLPF